jgi:hypothetical protein
MTSNERFALDKAFLLRAYGQQPTVPEVGD